MTSTSEKPCKAGTSREGLSREDVSRDGAHGACGCGDVRYRISTRPLIVHGCHCSLCQRQTGAAYAVNALIEEDRVELLSGSLKSHLLATPTGAGQTIFRCEKCGVALWSKYHALPKVGDHVLFVRVGTLDDPGAMAPDVHIHVSTRQRHVVLPADAQHFDGFYDIRRVWSDDSLQRYADIAGSRR
jgi:hypothetical protein